MMLQELAQENTLILMQSLELGTGKITYSNQDSDERKPFPVLVASKVAPSYQLFLIAVHHNMIYVSINKLCKIRATQPKARK